MRPESHRTDVIVVGAGNAALVTALAAKEEGADVLVLEAATEEERGGNSRFSGGLFRIEHEGLDTLLPLVGDEARAWAPQLSIDPYTRERFVGDLMETSDGRADPTLTSILVEQSNETVAWMRDQGVTWEFPVGKLIDPDLIEEDRMYVIPSGGPIRAVDEGVGLVQMLFDAVEAADIDVWYESPAHDLITSGNQVLGVNVRTDDGVMPVYGQVVLACGGFEAIPEMRLRYLGQGWDLVKVRGTRYNMGAVLERAIEAGAQPAGHWGGCHASPLDADAPDVGDLRLTDKMSRYSYPFALLVNQAGERFVDEGEDEVWLTYAKTGAAIRAQAGAQAVQVFDQKVVHLLEPRYSTGTPIEADTLEDLATKAGVDPAGLVRTVEDFNAATTGGEFDPFGVDGLSTTGGLRPPKSNWAQPLDTPPYVAYRVTCGITFTYGGLRIDEQARVMSQQWRPMPGLFATGEIAGGFFYHNYPAGSGLVRGAVFGRIAGQQAARASRGSRD